MFHVSWSLDGEVWTELEGEGRDESYFFLSHRARERSKELRRLERICSKDGTELVRWREGVLASIWEFTRAFEDREAGS